MERATRIAMERLAPVERTVKGARGCGWFDPSRPVVVGRAPGRLDVMGGVADYSGSLVCEMPLGIAAAVVVQERRDGKIVALSAQEPRNPIEISAQALQTDDPAKLAATLSGDLRWGRYVVGTWWWLTRGSRPWMRGKPKRSASAPNGGITIYADSDVPPGGGVASSAAIEVAAMAAGAPLVGARMGLLELAVACQYVENHVVGAPCGVMDQVTSAMGKEGTLVEILCQRGRSGLPAQVLGEVKIPRGYAFVGIHSGVAHEVSGDPYTEARIAAFMGQKILSQLDKKDVTHGWLANVNPRKYREQWRQELPESITGVTFLKKFGETNDLATKVNPRTAYRVREGTDHGVFEMERVAEFVTLLKEADRVRRVNGGYKPSESILRAGELMYASHASYTNCVHLDHPLTDKLVDMVRKLGPEHGFYGAKVTGGGSGGTVAILMRDTPTCRRYVQALRRRYEQATRRKTMYFQDTSPGVTVGVFGL